MPYPLEKLSFSMIFRFLDCSKMTILRRIKREVESAPEPEIFELDVEFDEMWYFLKNLTKFGLSERFVVLQGKPSFQLSVTMIMQRFLRIFLKIKHLKNCNLFSDEWKFLKKIFRQKNIGMARNLLQKLNLQIQTLDTI